MVNPAKDRGRSAGILVSFYRGEVTDSEGRRLDEIQSWEFDRLEYTHDYIQWLFPLKTRSGANPDAPALDAAQIEAFRGDAKLKERLLKSFKLMLSFYGLQCEEMAQGIHVTRSSDFRWRKRNWLNEYNHNYLRITRIIISLRLLGLESHARAFFECLDQIYAEEGDRIGEVTYGYWKRAAENPL